MSEETRNDEELIENETPSEPVLDDDNTELAGRIFEERTEKQPLFVLEPRKPGCNRDDKTLLLSKKVGFFGLVSFLILSIVFGAITKAWPNGLNLLFMGLAVLSYGVQDILHLKAISNCQCQDCTLEKKKLKNIIIICVVVAVVLIALACVKQFTPIKPSK